MGAVAFGCSEARPVDSRFKQFYDHWIAAGHNGSLDYMRRYGDVRHDPRLLLPARAQSSAWPSPTAPPAAITTRSLPIMPWEQTTI